MKGKTFKIKASKKLSDFLDREIKRKKERHAEYVERYKNNELF